MNSFLNQFDAYQVLKKRTHILPTKKYDEIVNRLTTMSSESESEKRKRTTEEANWARRYSIQCIQQSMILYNHGDKGENEQPKRVVKKEELFDVLTSTHKRLGHAGRDLMWKELRGTARKI